MSAPICDYRTIAEENLRIAKLRVMVDTTAVVIRSRPLSRIDAEQIVTELRRRVVALFPGKAAVFDLIYRPRFRRIIDDRFGPTGS